MYNLLISEKLENTTDPTDIIKTRKGYYIQLYAN